MLKETREKYEKILKEFQDCEEDLQNPDIIKTPNKLQEASQKHAELNQIATQIFRLFENKKEIENTKDIINNSKDQEMVLLAEEEVTHLEEENRILEKTIQKLSRNSDPNDKRNAILEIRAGTGGEEAALFAADLFRMYTRFTESQNWNLQVLSTNYTGNGGFKEIIAQITGLNAYGKLKYENGVHRVQRVPATESAGRIHTSAASVVILPEVNDIPDITIDEQDIKVDVYRAGGPGGQSVNTTDSAVRITHIPTNIVVTCQDEKSQHKNKARALSILKSRLYQIKQEEIAAKADSKRKSAIKSGDRSAKIRTYNFPQGRVTDHRIKQSWHNLEEILDGNIDEIISTTTERLSNENDT